MAFEILAVEIDRPQIARRIASGLVVEMGRGRVAASPPAVTAQARRRGPNSTTATKLLPLVPYQRRVPG